MKYKIVIHEMLVICCTISYLLGRCIYKRVGVIAQPPRKELIVKHKTNISWMIILCFTLYILYFNSYI